MSEVSMKAEVIKFSLYIVDNFYCNRKVQFLQVLKESQVRYHKIRIKNSELVQSIWKNMVLWLINISTLHIFS